MLLTLLAAQSLLTGPAAIDFAAIPRTIRTEPDYVSKPRYGLFLFGENADVRVWAVLDRSSEDAEVYDVLYLDRDADGVLGEDGERFVGEVEKAGTDKASAKFAIGDFIQPTGKKAAPAAAKAEKPVKHTKFEVTWTPSSVRYRMNWRGKEVTMGSFGPTRDTYAGFGKSADDATVFVPGFDRPLEFERWLSDTLIIGGASDFKVFLGAKGSKRGAFSCGDQKLLPKGEYAIATLIYTSEDNEEKRAEVKLRERC